MKKFILILSIVGVLLSFDTKDKVDDGLELSANNFLVLVISMGSAAEKAV